MGTKRTDRTQATKDMRDYLLASGAHGLATTQGPNGSGLDWYALNGVVIIMQTMAGAEGFEVFAPVTTSNSIADTYAAVDRMEKFTASVPNHLPTASDRGAAKAIIAEMEGRPEAVEPSTAKRTVKITVEGGVAFVDECPDDVEVIIDDHDVLEPDDDDESNRMDTDD